MKKIKTKRKLPKNYWLYWLASAVSMAASNILQYILSLYILDITGSAAVFASMLSVIIFPRLLLTPAAGVIADRIRKIRLMSGVLFMEAVVLATYFVIGNFVPVSVAAIFILVVALEIGEVFYEGAVSAILPELVGKEQIKDALAFSKIDDGIVVVASPMAAAFIYSHIDIAAAFAVVACLNLLSGMMQMAIRPAYENTSKNMREKQTLWEDFVQGLNYIRGNLFLRVFVMALPLASAFFGATFSVSVMVLLRKIYGLNTYAYGLYNSVTASMSLLVPVLAVPVVRKYSAEKIFSVSTFLIALEIAGIGLLSLAGVNGWISIMTSVVGITVLDCMTIAEAVPMQMAASVLLQTGVDKKILGRVSSTISMVSVGASAMGNFLFGILNDITYIWVSMLIGAAGVGLASFVYRKKCMVNRTLSNIC